MVVTIIIFQGLLFGGLIFILRQFMKGHVSGAVGHLQKLNEELVKQQNELKQKMADAQKEYESKMGNLQEEIQQKQGQVRDEANKMLDESRQRALQEREKIINEAVETRDKMRQEVMAQMEEKAVFHSRAILGEFFSGEMHAMIHEFLVREVVQGLQEISVEAFQISTDTAELTTAMPLSAELKGMIQKVLKDKIQKDVQFKEDVDASLVAGVILKFGTFVIDGSMTHRLKEAAAYLKKETARRYQGNT